MYLHLWLTFLLAGALDQPHVGLRDSVTAFWTHLACNDKASALKYVLEECHNAFIMRRDPVIRSWKIVSVNPKDDGTADVMVSIEGLFPNVPRILTVDRAQRWVLRRGAWKLEVKEATIAEAAKMLGISDQPPKLAGFRVSPNPLRIHFFHSAQTGVVSLENGEDSEAELLDVQYDAQRFEITQRPDKVEAGRIGRLVVRYKGTEEAKDLTSQISLRLRHGGKEEVFQVPVVYNYISEAARGLFGLTREQAQALRRGEKLTPVLQAPKTQPGGQTTPTPREQPAPPAGAGPHPD